MEINSIPEELLSQILIKLPTKSILQFRSVCKFWHSLIANSDFISLHLKHTQLNNPNLVLFRRILIPNLQETYNLYNDDEYFNLIETLYFPFKSNSGCFTILGFVNGLVCLWDFKSGFVLFWNPSIRKCYTLPDCCSSKLPPGRVFGFGYDALNDDYKVVRRVCNDHSEVRDEPVEECLGSVFSLREKCWRKIDFVPNWNTQCRPRTVRGVIRRVTSCSDHRMKIVSFNLSSESCSEFACPDEVNNVSPLSQIELSIFHESLALIHTVDVGKNDIWVLREDGVVKSWSKLFSIDLGESMWQQFIAGFSGSGLVVMVGRPGAVVKPIVVNPVIVNLELSGPEYHWHVESYKESLVLLQEGDDVTLLAQNDGDDKRMDVEDAPVTIIIDYTSFQHVGKPMYSR